jgi:hypothetical protein
LSPTQVFVKGAALKEDLAKLNAYYSALPADVRRQGAMRLATYPPVAGDFLTTRLWDQLMKPTWRSDAAAQPVQVSQELQGALRDLLKKFKAADIGSDRGPLTLDDAAAVVMESKAPLRIGSWDLFPPEVKPEPKE